MSETRRSETRDLQVSDLPVSVSQMKFEDEDGECKREGALRYIEKNREAMDYGEYNKEGLPLGSGAAEGGCKLIGYRTNGCGRRWGYEGCVR